MTTGQDIPQETRTNARLGAALILCGLIWLVLFWLYLRAVPMLLALPMLMVTIGILLIAIAGEPLLET